MAYNPISGSPVQFSNENNELAVDYYLKFYIANTTTPLSMATDADGTTTLVKCKLNSEGFPITNPLDDSTVFIPYVNQNFRYVIYKNETDADNDDTANALVNIAEASPLLEQGSDWKISQTGDYFTYGGTANAITLTSVNTTPVTSLVDRQRLRVFITVANTGAATANVDGTGAKTVVTPTGVALPADFFRTDVITELEYDLGNDQFIAYRKVESGSNANGAWTRLENGELSVRIKRLELPQTDTFRCLATWNYPLSFSSLDDLYVELNGISPNDADGTNAIASLATPATDETLLYAKGSITTSSVALAAFRVSGATNFSGGDFMYVSAKAEGKWY